MDFQDQKTAPPKASKEKVARNPNNANILKGGQVDPRSQLYQRSIAGREQLKDYLSRLSNSGADEADVFMAGVKSLMTRKHGYVGAYLDSKNPGRRYEKNQAMAITDKVMTDEGIGENPGARLTRPKVTDEEGKVDKDATKEARDKRKEGNEGRGFGPQQAPGPSAKPVGQQRKEGKRESTGQALEDSRRDPNIDKPGEGPFYQPVSKKDGSGSVDVKREWQQEMASGFEKIKKDLKTGAITPEEAKSQISELNNRSKEFVKGGKQEREQGLKDDAAVYKRREDRKKQRDGGAQDQPPGGEARPGAGDTQQPPDGGGGAAPEEKEDPRVIPHKDIQDTFRDLVKDTKEKNKENISRIIPEIAQIFEEDYGIKMSNDEVIDSIRKAEGYSRFLDQYQIGSGKKVEKTAATREEVSQPKAAPDRQAQATDEDVMRRATLLGDKKPAAPTEQPTAPQEGKKPVPSTAAPEAKTPQPGQQEAAAPQVKYKKPNIEEEWNEAARYPEFETAGIEAWSDAVKNGTTNKFSQLGKVKNVDLNYDSLDEGKKNNFQRAFKDGVIETPVVGRWGDGSYELIAGNTRLSGLVKSGVDPTVMVVDFPSGEGEKREPLPEERLGRGRKRSGGKAAPGFTTEIGKGATDTIRQAVSQGKSVEEVVEQFKQGNLFGQTGFETGSAATNPLEDSPPDQYERFRGDPAEKFKGAQAGGREQDSGSLFVNPETAKKRGVKSTIDTESGPAENPELYTSPRTGAGYGPAGKEQKERIESKNAIQRVATENMTKEEKDKISSDILGGGGTLREARQATGTKPRKAKKARKPKTINSAEYQEFSQSVRSLLR